MKNLTVIFSCILFIALLCLSACSKNDRLEYALEFAGDNRNELEKVLEYYKNNVPKLKAACFLIENMPGHYGVYKDKNGNDVIKQDARIITADYLIRNIDFSFDVWKQNLWGKYVSFNDFCELILPYRISNEPLEEWREAYYKEFRYILDQAGVTEDMVIACQLINLQIQEYDRFNFHAVEPYINPLKLLRDRAGGCVEQTALVTFACRALGIPVGIDGVIKNPDSNHRHQWNFVLDTTGNTIAFTDRNTDPQRNIPPKGKFFMHANPKAMGVVYRYTYARQDELSEYLLNEKYIPNSFSNYFMKNVSDLYFVENEVSILCDENYTKDNVVYLAVFNNANWEPVLYSQIKKKQAAFKCLEPGIVFLPVYCRADGIHPAGSPFYFSKDENKLVKLNITNKNQTMLVTRKNPVRETIRQYMQRVVGGIFEGANNIDFIGSTILYEITDINKLSFHDCEIQTDKAFKYLRYLSPDGSFGNIAEIEFYNKSGKKIEGDIIGTESLYNDDLQYGRESVFDGDPLSFFETKQLNGSWVGLKLDRPESIGKIRYLSRNDDNNIRMGDVYKLYYWGVNGWNLLGRKTGDIFQQLIFEDVPVGTLYWLRNITRGKEERIFTYENGEQIWW